MRKGTIQAIGLIVVFLFVLWAAAVRLAASLVCDASSALLPSTGAAPLPCRPSSWLWPAVELDALSSREPLTVGDWGVAWSFERAVLSFDLGASFRYQTPKFALDIRRVHAEMSATAGAAEESLAPETILARGFSLLAWEEMPESAFSRVHIRGARVTALQLHSSPPRRPLARDVDLTWLQPGPQATFLELTARIGPWDDPVRLRFERVALDGTRRELRASGFLRLWDALVIEIPGARALVTPSELSVPELRLKANGSPLFVSGAVPTRDLAAGHFDVEWRNLQIGPIIDALWLDMRGALQGRLDGRLAFSLPPLENVGDVSHWSLTGRVEGRRINWSGGNLLYGLLTQAQAQATADNESRLPAVLRQRFPEALAAVETSLQRVEANLAFSKNELTVQSLTLHGQLFTVHGGGAVTLAPRWAVRGDFTLRLDQQLSAAVCESLPSLCPSPPTDGTLVLKYAWEGDLIGSRPQWVPPAP